MLRDIPHAFTEHGQGEKIVAMQGKVIQRGDLLPIRDQVYEALEREQANQMEAQRSSKVLQVQDKGTHVPEPFIHPPEEGRAVVKEKRYAMNKDALKQRLFQLFAEAPLWSFDELSTRTEEPDKSLKVALNEICDHHMQGTKRHKYELKAEFQVSAPPPV